MCRGLYSRSHAEHYHLFVPLLLLFFYTRSLILGFGNIISAAPVVAIIFYSILIAWLSAARKLSTLFVAQTEMDKAEKAKKE